ncbi:hypothetical protein P3S68_002404 [Capsicum galapagoense]
MRCLDIYNCKFHIFILNDFEIYVEVMRSNEFYRRPNRQRTTRVPNEMDRGPAVYGRASGLCRQTGHDRRRCPTHNQT